MSGFPAALAIKNPKKMNSNFLLIASVVTIKMMSTEETLALYANDVMRQSHLKK